MKLRIIFSLILLIICGCTHSLHLSHVSDFSPTFKELNSGKFVQAKTEQFVIMGLVTQTDYVNQTYQKLLNTCPNGSIQGITSQYYTSHGFFSWTNYVEMQGLCITQ